jgi:hypothetical protein
VFLLASVHAFLVSVPSLVFSLTKASLGVRSPRARVFCLYNLRWLA